LRSDSTEQTYKKLCEDYDEIIKEPIVLEPAKDPTIFDISAYPHYENVISNWYAFFFNPRAEHSLGDLFLQSLVEIINAHEDHGEFLMESCHVEREFPTDKGGFIDLVLYQQAEDGEKFESAIIIENKIYAGLYNALRDYYNSVKTEDEQKVGIVLSLHKTQGCLPPGFINITHEQLLEVVQHNLGKYVVTAKPRYILYLQDFISNLERMTRPVKMQDSIKYYFENAEKIDKFFELREQATNYLREELADAIQGNNFEPKRDAEGAFRFTYSKDPRILFYMYHISNIRKREEFILQAWLHGEKVDEHWKQEEGRKGIYPLSIESCEKSSVIHAKNFARWC